MPSCTSSSIKTDVSQDKLAADADEAGKMDETGTVGETGDMQIGESKTFTVTLTVTTGRGCSLYPPRSGRMALTAPLGMGESGAR